MSTLLTMQLKDLNHVGDEPIYCETEHDDVLYSGSEDDYYEAPEHRRLRIEAKAVQFLNGNLPYLLSARLKGPFSSKSWNNPWKSKRAQHQAVQVQNQSQSRRSMSTVEAARGHSSGRGFDDLPDTQRTSLYPLPSPETTNPPSARKNSYMAEEEFNRIKTWRETVKSVPVSTDPFWASQQDERQQASVTRKRSADQDWLRKRESKKRKSEDLRKLASEESPSQTAAKMKRSLLQDRFAEIVTQSAPGSSTHEDELAAQWGPNTASFDTSRMANIPINTPGVLQTTRTPQLPTRQLLAQDLDSSEDELSMPSIVPSRNTSRSPLKQSQYPNAEDTPSRRQRRDSGDASRSRGCAGTARSGPDCKSPRNQQLSMERPDYISSQRKETANAAQLVRQDVCGEALGASQTDIPRSQMAHQEKSTKLAKRATRRGLGASQQDNSFYFHQAASKSPLRRRELSRKKQTKGTAIRLTPSRHGLPALASECSTRQDDQLCVEDDQVRAPAPSDHQMNVILSGNQEIIPAGLELVSKSDERVKVAGAANHVNSAVQSQLNEASSMVESRSETQAEALGQLKYEKSQSYTNADPDLSTPACTQELSPVSMQYKVQSTVEFTNGPETHPPTTILAVDNTDSSNLEWSTYINTQDLSAMSEKNSPFGEAAQDIEVVPQGADSTNDADWTTYVNTQDVTNPSIEDGTALKDEDEFITVEQGSDCATDPECSTFVNTRDQYVLETHCEGFAVAEDGRALHLELSDHKVMESAADDRESGSRTSSSMSVSSQGDADQTGDTSDQPVLTEATAAESRSAHVNLGSIVHAYAGSKKPHHGPEKCPEGQLSAGDQQIPDVAIDRLGARMTQEADGQQVKPTVPVGGEVSSPVAPMEQSNQSVGTLENSAFKLDETTVSLESTIPSLEEAPVQSPWAKGGNDLPMPIFTGNDTTSKENTSRLSFLAGQALAFSPAPQTPWAGDRLPSPDFSLSVKKFSDFMRPSPLKKRASASGSILRASGSTSRVLFGTSIHSKPERRVTFAPLPGEEPAAPGAPKLNGSEIYVEEDLSYFDANGNKTASIRVTRSQTRAASPPPSDVDSVNADELPDHDNKFARHFEAMSRRKKDPPRRAQRLLPSESQQTNSSQPIDAMAEAFIQASQTRNKSSELVKAVNDNARLVQSSSEKIGSPMTVNAIEQQENTDPVDDVSAVLDNIDDFLDNSWGFDTSLNIDSEKGAPARQQAESVPSRFAKVGDPMVAMHANVWAD